jgi:hypothetical protein
MFIASAPGVDFINICTYAFSCKQDEKHLLTNVIYQMANKFGKWQTNLAKFSTVVWQNSAISVKMNDEFFAERCA